MGYTARFLNENKLSVLEMGLDHPHQLDRDFVPPGTSIMYDQPGGASRQLLDGPEVYETGRDNISWDFTVNIYAQSKDHVTALANQLANALSLAKWFEYKSDDFSIPIWGQCGSPRRYEIKAYNVSINKIYPLLIGSGRPAFGCPVSLTVAPNSLGYQQANSYAAGSINEDNVGSPLPRRYSLGTQIMPAGTNKIPNGGFNGKDPYTYLNGFFFGGDSYPDKNTDQNFVLFGSTSVKLTSLAATSNNHLYTSVAAGNTNPHVISIYAKRRDSSPIVLSDVKFLYSVQVDPTHILNVGNGWYRLWAYVNGIVAAANIGVGLTTAASALYFDGFQFEESPVLTPFIWGDDLGNAWTGTVYISTASRAAATCYIIPSDFGFQSDQGSFTVVWKPDNPSGKGSGTGRIVCQSSGYRLHVDFTNRVFVFNDNGASAITSGAYTWAAGDIFHITCEWGAGTKAMYVNGVSVGSNAVTSPTVNNNFFIGTNNTPIEYCRGTIIGLDFYDKKIGFEEAARYANYSKVSAAGLNISRLGWLYNDSLEGTDDSSRNNWCVVSAIPGDQPALTRWEITPSVAGKTGYWLMKQEEDYFIYPSVNNWAETGAVADAAASGGLYASNSYGGSGADPSYMTVTTLDPFVFSSEIHYFIRVKHSTGAGNYAFRPWADMSSGARTWGKAVAVTISTIWTWYYIGSMDIHPKELFGRNFADLGLGCEIQYTSAVAANHKDYIHVLSGDVLRLVGYGSYANLIVVEGLTAYQATTLKEPVYPFTVRGGVPIDVSPSTFNVVWFHMGDTGETDDVTDTATIKGYFTPRWSL